VAVQLREQGETFVAIATTLGVSRAIVMTWWARYQKGGVAALASGQRGRRLGAQRRLTATQEAAIRRAITDTTPDQLKLPFALWTRVAIVQYIQQRYGIALPVRTMGHYLKRWGFTAQKPLKRAYEQRPEAIAEWLKVTYPRIQRRARIEGAEIHWGDETSLSTSDPRGRGFAPRGRTPVRTVLSQRRSVSVLSTISNSGTLRFMVLKKAIDAPTLIRFFTRLLRDAGQKVFVILDNLNVHKAQAVRDWVAVHADEIALFYLPPYAPELNPDEYLNGDLKLSVARRAPARDRDGLLRTTTARLRSLQRRPHRVRKFFEHPRVRYAA
jgi:transposase